MKQNQAASAGQIVAALNYILLQSDIRHGKHIGKFPDFGEDFDFLSYALGRCRANYAQMAQDLWVLYELKEKRGGYFVEFGAGDGRLLSNTYLLETEYGWHGVLAEPNPVSHAALRRNRRAYISEKCIAGASGEAAIFNCTADPHLATIDRYTDQDAHAEARRSGQRISVATQSLNDLLREANAPRRIDYMSVDTEGSEYEILSAFDFSAYDITLLTVEHNHTPRRRELDDLLISRGFRPKFQGLSDFDGWYVRTG